MFGFGDSAQPPEVKKPLGFFGKLAAGIKGFIKTAADYLPRGLVFDALFIGGLAVAATQFGFDPLGFVQEGSLNWAKMATKAVLSLSLGAAISGSVGAYREIKHASQTRNTELIAQALELQRYREHDYARGRAQSHDDISLPSGLPLPGSHGRER